MCPYNIERLNKELKRRPRAIGIFPNEASLLRLMGSVLIERHEALSRSRAIFSHGTLATLMQSEVPAKLVIIAVEQQKLLAA